MSNSLLHWNLVLRPFEAAWDTRFFYPSPSHQEALDRLAYVVHERSLNFALLSGEIGCGKTLVRSVLQHHLPASSFRLLVLENSGFRMDDLLAALLARLDTPHATPPSTPLERLDRVRSLLEAEAAAGRHVVLLCDEAQDLSADTLNGLRWLTNFNGGGASLLTILLIGQPDLRARVESIPALDQRIGLRYHLRPLAAPDQTAAYLAHRLHAAGHPTGELFDREAAALLHQFSAGIPRTLNRLAKLTLEYGWCSGADRLSASHVHAVARDLHRQSHLAANPV